MDEPEKEYETVFDDILKTILNKDYLVEYKRKAENGDVLAQRILGDIFFYGITADKAYFRNLNDAVWYAKTKGNYELISECHEKPNYEEALKWYKRAAKNGDTYAGKHIEKIWNGVSKNSSSLATQFFAHEEMKRK